MASSTGAQSQERTTRSGRTARTMPFGRYKGSPLTDVETNYLFWLLSLSDLKSYLSVAVKNEVRARGLGELLPDEEEPQEEKKRPPRAASYRSILVRTPPAGIDQELLLRLVAEGRKSMARHHHPDIGGTTEQMQAINAGADWLVEVLEGL